jgi:hypothetical protein
MASQVDAVCCTLYQLVNPSRSQRNADIGHGRFCAEFLSDPGMLQLLCQSREPEKRGIPPLRTATSVRNRDGMFGTGQGSTAGSESWQLTMKVARISQIHFRSEHIIARYRFYKNLQILVDWCYVNSSEHPDKGHR